MPDTSTPSTVQQELLTASGDTVLANIEAAATTSSVELTGVSVDSLADPQLQNSTTAVVASSLTFTGLTAEDAEALVVGGLDEKSLNVGAVQLASSPVG